MGHHHAAEDDAEAAFEAWWDRFRAHIFDDDGGRAAQVGAGRRAWLTRTRSDPA